ncbi:uncharacterized protein LOC129594811 [Paramacrobiotus metropolitanus]|uniref:uncharacterized protein LOC129594811 n=1 Tax=Paramacrobiotus metropolitanus TaxID=2943436 RepID=UPI00244560FF|nr:uncharacterized protein LOC129594811 [Paramacrobiotus metropolitanus]
MQQCRPFSYILAGLGLLVQVARGFQALGIGPTNRPVGSPYSRPQASYRTLSYPGYERCQYGVNVPNIIRGQLTNVEDLMGIWYGALAYPDYAVITENYQTEFVSYGKTHLPGTNTPAYAVSRTESYFNVTSTSITGCIDSFAATYVTVDGRQIGTAYVLGTDPADPTSYIVVSTELIIVYTDYGTMCLIYQCGQRNEDSGHCDSPLFYVLTKTRPDQLTRKTKEYIDTVINGELRPYCIRATDFTELTWNTAHAACPAATAPDCYIQLMDSIKDTVTY